MGIMVLNLHDRNPLLLRHNSRIILRMQITDSQLRLCFQQLLHPDNRLLQSGHRPGIRHISNIGRQIQQLILPDAEVFFSSPPTASTCRFSSPLIITGRGA